MEIMIFNIILGICCFFTLIVLVNFFTAPVIREMPFEHEDLPEVTVLIPARNEESVINDKKKETGLCLPKLWLSDSQMDGKMP